MTSREEITLELTKVVLERITLNSDTAKECPYEIYNSIYNNIETYLNKDKN